MIKDRVSTPDLFEFYGFYRDRGGFIKCPFHEEKTGSMKVYDGDGGYHCFGGCGAHGDIISFVQNYFRVSFKDAISKINDDFRLGFPIDSSLDREFRRKVQKEAEERQKARERLKFHHQSLQNAYENALHEWVRLDRQRQEYAPKTKEEPPHALFLEALRSLELAAYRLDCAENELYLFERQKL